MLYRYHFPAFFAQYPHGGAHEQGINDPWLPLGLLIYIVQSFASDLLSGFGSPLGKEFGNVVFTEIGKQRGIRFNIERRTGIGGDASFGSGDIIL
jgi:hypothetical protein